METLRAFGSGCVIVRCVFHGDPITATHRCAGRLGIHGTGILSAARSPHTRCLSTAGCGILEGEASLVVGPGHAFGLIIARLTYPIAHRVRVACSRVLESITIGIVVHPAHIITSPWALGKAPGTARPRIAALLGSKSATFCTIRRSRRHACSRVISVVTSSQGTHSEKYQGPHLK